MTLFDLLACPLCGSGLSRDGGDIACEGCPKRFPVVAGIPDLRVDRDPWIGLEDDRAKALRVLEEARGGSFEAHVRAYWHLTPRTPTDRAERFTDHVLTAAERSGEWLAVSRTDVDAPEPAGPWLDLGCGTGDLAAAAPGHVAVVGVDVAMRWLVIARRRLEEAGRPVRLVCANAEALPFPERTFGRVLSLGLVEHCESLTTVLDEAYRVLRGGGDLLLRTTNRFSLLPEPHVGLWGVGFLPRGWADRYVRWRTGTGYRHHHPWSAGQIRRALHRSGFRSVRVRAAATLSAEIRRASSGVRTVAPLYERARRTPLVRHGLRAVAPLLEAEARRQEDSEI